jgi:putative ATP-dependent endonuclease of the OLD family
VDEVDMRIQRIQIENFRNFKSLDVMVGPNLVLVGENKVGKSNLLQALRLVLDPSLPDSSRRLRIEDFWDGSKPLTEDSRITISVDLADFEDNVGHITVLSDYLVEHTPMVARLTYAFFPKPDLESVPSKEADFDFAVYGRDELENLVSHDVRKRLPMDLLPALRDAEADLSNWRRSPLRPLLDSLSGGLDDDTKKRLAKAIGDATQAIAGTPEVTALGKSISEMLLSLAGSKHGVSTSLSFLPTDTDRLIRTLRVFVENGTRSISEASLGSTNLIYLALKLLEVELEVAEKVRGHSFLAIEEPEAHLHPHVQRRVFRSFLRPRKHQPPVDGEEPSLDRTILLTTHSPHIASVTPLDSLIVLRSEGSPVETIARSTLGAGLAAKEVEDLERYLDVTRGELLFAKGVLLVEGEAETYLVPVFARLLGFDLDELGISVCSVAGTNFLPYAKLLGRNGLGIPFAAITDEDPVQDKQCLAFNRVRKLVNTIDPEYEYSEDASSLFDEAESDGIFVTPHTLEVALFKCGRHGSITKTIEELSPYLTARTRAKGWREAPASVDAARLVADIEQIGKGRFAQRLASHIAALPSKTCPSSVKGAVSYVAERV